MKHLKWRGPILDMSGYASAARGYLKSAIAAGVNIQARDMSRSVNLWNKGMDDEIVSMYARLSSVDVPKNCPCVQHQVPDCFRPDKNSVLPIGYTIFEMTSVPRPWVSKCNEMAVIWTGSDYSKRAFVGSGVSVPVEVLPHAIDADLYSPSARPWSISNRRAFAFLSVFDFTPRKAWRDLLRAYWTAFRRDEDVCLILKVYYGGFDAASQVDVLRRIAKYKAELKLGATPPILVYGHDVPANMMPGLYRSADCYVGVSREGFGLPMAEAMASGLPCIGPASGGNREYMTPENSLLVEHVGDEPVSKEMVATYPAFEGLSWSRHSWEHLAVLMRRVFEDDGLRKRLALSGREHVKNNLSHEAIGLRMAALLPG
jgi:glycosyltransferase involved in cell wall biosynthesis